VVLEVQGSSPLILGVSRHVCVARNEVAYGVGGDAWLRERGGKKGSEKNHFWMQLKVVRHWWNCCICEYRKHWDKWRKWVFIVWKMRLLWKIGGLVERTINKSSIIKVSTCLVSMCKARNIRTDLHVFFLFCWVLPDNAEVCWKKELRMWEVPGEVVERTHPCWYQERQVIVWRWVVVTGQGTQEKAGGLK